MLSLVNKHANSNRRDARRGVRATAVAVAITIVASACAGGDSIGSPPGTTPTAGQTPTDQPTTSIEPSPVAAETPTVGPGATPESTPRPVGRPPTFIDENGFNDHTVPTLASVDEFFALATTGVGGQSVVKFTIPAMLTETHGPRWMDSNFFTLHDEWYIFRLANGQAVPAIDTEPTSGNDLATIDDVYNWAGQLGNGNLPFDLRFIDSQFSTEPRLYSARYYRAGLGDQPRNYGLGSVIHVPVVDDRPERWLIELEFSDDPSAAEVTKFFEQLSGAAPPAIADALEWVVRSPAQEETATAMEQADTAFADRIARYREVFPAGTISVYNEGIAAGRLLYVGEGGGEIAEAGENDILILEHVPDWLPPAAALITDAPQTPLAHVNLLARNRGIPNASQAGLVDDAGIRQAARVRAFAIVRAEGERIEITLISREEYTQWQDAQVAKPISVPPADLDDVPAVIDLSELAREITNDDGLARWRPVIGGKSTGFLTLLDTPGVNIAHRPLAITVEPYLDHLAEVEQALDAMLDDNQFQNSVRARFLLLEGPSDFADFANSEADQRFAEDFINEHRPGTLLGDILDADGFKKYFRDVPMDRGTLNEIVEALELAYGNYLDTQGLRFRSSSSVEDIEGFSGAGLYDSSTGYLVPSAQDEADQKKTVEWAIKKTWASYWGFEAYEERRLEAIEHKTGAMGVTVHARMDDHLERDNGVATFTLLPDGAEDQSLAIINVQVGAESVTNPDPTSGVLPGVVEIRRDRNGDLSIEAISTSTLASGPILTNPELADLFDQLEATTELWRDRINSSLDSAQAVQTVTLDFEFKHMLEGWPAVSGGGIEPERLVIKQARSLDPGLRGVPESILALDIPRDVLARARLVVARDCGADELSMFEVFTDTLLSPDMGYAESPFVVGDRSASECRARTIWATPDQLLLELLYSGQRLELGS